MGSANDPVTGSPDEGKELGARAQAALPCGGGSVDEIACADRNATAVADVRRDLGMPAAVSAPARVDAVASEPLAPERYKVQFTATEEYVRLVDEAKALLSHAAPSATLEELHLRAMRALVSELTRKKYATLERSPATERANHPRQRGRHIPAAVRRAVFERDGNRCTYVDADGRRCAEAHRLEFHQLRPFAASGEHAAANLTLRCRAHNALAAEQDFGREQMEDKRSSAHEHLPSHTCRPVGTIQVD